jgi:hypothetical protein
MSPICSYRFFLDRPIEQRELDRPLNSPLAMVGCVGLGSPEEQPFIGTEVKEGQLQ